MAETLTGSQRLRAFITGRVERIAELEEVVDGLHQDLTNSQTIITDLRAEIAGFQGLADEYAPDAPAEAPAKR